MLLKFICEDMLKIFWFGKYSVVFCNFGIFDIFFLEVIWNVYGLWEVVNNV